MGNAPTILYVDDQPSHRTLFQKAFRSQYEIVTAASGEEGLEIIKKNKVVLVITDYNMPGMSGIEFLAKASEIDPQVEKAIISAYLDDGVLEELKKRVVKVTGRFEKPWKMDRIRHYIDKVLEKKSLIESSEWVSLPADEVAEEEKAASLPISTPSLCGESLPVASVSYEGLVQILITATTEHISEPAAKKIFGHFVEPRINDDMMTLRPPCPEFLKQAQLKALAGDIDGLEKILSGYFLGEGVTNIVARLVSSLQRNLH